MSDEKDKEIERLRSLLAEEPTIAMRDGGFDIGPHWAVRLLAGSLANTLEDIGAENYVTMDVKTPVGLVSVTIQRVGPGKKTPSQKQAELQARIDELQAALEKERQEPKLCSLWR